MRLRARHFNLDHTLACGQTFFWSKVNNEWEGVLGEQKVALSQRGDTLHILADNEKQAASDVEQYFNLNLDLAEVHSQINKDKFIGAAICAFDGLRVISEPAFRCLIGYICSANSNIPKIKRDVARLSESFGSEIAQGIYDFPTPKQLAEVNLQKLKSLGLGFRAKYILDASKQIVSGAFDLGCIKTKAYVDAKLNVMSLAGVGPKVADCVLLFAGGKTEAFPVDVWTKRIMKQYYMRGDPSFSEIASFGRRYFGKYAGYAQEYLFYYSRKVLKESMKRNEA